MKNINQDQDIVNCCNCIHCHLKDKSDPLQGGWCCVDAPAHISAVAALHYCSYGIKKSPSAGD